MSDDFLDVPPSVKFADLNFRFIKESNQVSFNPVPLVAIFDANGIPIRKLKNPNYIFVSAINQWYKIHRQQGGEPNDYLEMKLRRH
jgi:hypothetical protein